MPRVRVRFLIKLSVAVITMLLLGPYLFHLRLNENSSNDAEEYRKWQIHHKIKVKDEVIHHKPIIKSENEHNGEQQPRFAIKKKVEKAFLDVEKAFLDTQKNGNYEPPIREPKSLPGENGKAVHLSRKEQSSARHTVNEYGFNMVASDKITMDRLIPDTRPHECKFWQYPTNQLTASVILVFHNEGFSTLVRTIHSVINTSPPEFLKEVVLVDDFSDKDHLKSELEDYIKQFGDMVKLYRNKVREGLIRTRSRGAELATGDVIIFLDAHCECNKNWLVPLLDAIRENRTTMAVPIVDGINWNDFSYASVYGKDFNRGIFEWGFLYKEKHVPQKELSKRKHTSEPYNSPTHAGGLFAMDRKYFMELGGYDPGLMIWGGENYELSFKIWQCGGRIVWVPCSHVGHIYRNHMPYSLGKEVDPHMSPININYMRVVEVWMEDEYKNYFYTREPSLRGYPIGNITQQLKFKKEHKCKNFRWFMENVAYDVYENFPKPPPNKAWGEIRQKGGDLCWDFRWQTPGRGPIETFNCHQQGGSQQFRLNAKGQLGVGERCIKAQSGKTLSVAFCPVEPVGPWQWDEVTGLIYHQKLEKCVKGGADNSLHLEFCDKNNKDFQWVINEVFPWKN